MKEQVTHDETTPLGLAAVVGTVVFFSCTFAEFHLLLSFVAAVGSGATLFQLIRWFRSDTQ